MYQTIVDDSERRHALRIGAEYGDRQHVLLRVGRRELAAELLDQSSTGFSIQLARSEGRWRKGQRILLGTRSTWHEVKVIHVEKDHKSVRVGLETIQDFVEPKRSTALLWCGMMSLLLLATCVVYQRENPDKGLIHRCIAAWGQSTD